MVMAYGLFHCWYDGTTIYAYAYADLGSRLEWMATIALQILSTASKWVGTGQRGVGKANALPSYLSEEVAR